MMGAYRTRRVAVRYPHGTEVEIERYLDDDAEPWCRVCADAGEILGEDNEPEPCPMCGSAATRRRARPAETGDE